MRTDQIRVLLVEDDPSDGALLKHAIGRAGMPIELQWVKRVADAAKVLAEESFDIVLSDLSLPDSRGTETIEWLRREAMEIPIIVLTSVDDHNLATELLDSGAQDYIPKDRVTGDVLDRAIRHAIQRQQQRVEMQRLLQEVEDGRSLVESKNKKLEKLYKQAHEFVDNVSHEFRTPLTVIKEYAAIVCEGLAGDVTEKQIRMLNTVEDRADDLNTMVNDMLDSSKLESGLVATRRRPCGIEEIFDHVTTTISRKAQAKGVSLEYDIEDDLPELYCDVEKTGRTIINFAINGIKFCGDPGSVRITVRSAPDRSEILFGVEDDGPGIEPNRLQQIFERFQQLETNSHGSCKGFGLGLAIAKELIDLNLGKITVASEVGKGSKFGFSVPMNDPPEIMKRFLRYIQYDSEYLPLVSLLIARIHREPNQSGTDEIVSFLQNRLRCHDLILPTTADDWLLALPMNKKDTEAYCQQSDREREKASRNRLVAPLPWIEYQWLGTWRIPDECEGILEKMLQCVPRHQALCT